MEDLFRIELIHLDGTAEVALVGELDLSGGDELQRKVAPLLARYDGRLTLDCQRLRFIDLAGIRLLLQLARSSRSGRLRVRHAPPQMRQLVAFTKSAEVFEVEAIA